MTNFNEKVPEESHNLLKKKVYFDAPLPLYETTVKAITLHDKLVKTLENSWVIPCYFHTMSTLKLIPIHRRISDEFHAQGVFYDFLAKENWLRLLRNSVYLKFVYLITFCSVRNNYDMNLLMWSTSQFGRNPQVPP